MYTEKDFGAIEDYYEVNEPIPFGEMDEFLCLENAKNGYEEYANLVLKKNNRLIVSMSKKYQNRGLDMDELVSAARFGAFESIQKFDSSMGVKFSTFAYPIIKGRILREIENNGRPIRVPSNVFKEACHVKKTFDEMGEDATNKSVAMKLGKTENEVKNLLETIAPVAELDYYVDDEETTLCDLIPDENECEKLEKIHSKQSECLREIAKSFSEEESALIRTLFNFDSEWNSCGAPTNLNAAAKELGVSYSTAQRIFKSAKAKFIRSNEKYHIESLAA